MEATTEPQASIEKPVVSAFKEYVRAACPDCGYVFAFDSADEASERMACRETWHGSEFCASTRASRSEAVRKKLDVENYGSVEAAALMRGEITSAEAEASVAERAPVAVALAKAKADAKATGPPAELAPAKASRGKKKS